TLNDEVGIGERGCNFADGGTPVAIDGRATSQQTSRDQRCGADTHMGHEHSRGPHVQTVPSAFKATPNSAPAATCVTASPTQKPGLVCGLAQNAHQNSIWNCMVFPWRRDRRTLSA